MELIELIKLKKIPDEVVNNIIKFMSHPCADIINQEIIKRIHLYLTNLSENKVYKLYHKAKFTWENEVLEALINHYENERIVYERFESDDEADRFEEEDE